MRIQFIVGYAMILAACEPQPTTNVPEVHPGAQFMTAVSKEVVIDSEPTLDDNLDKGLEIVRSVCEGGFYSVSCASPVIYPPMKIDKGNLLPIELQVNVMAATQPNYVYIQCSTDKEPPPQELIETCYQLVVKRIAK